MTERPLPDQITFGVHPVLELVRTRPNAVEHLYLSRDPSIPEIREILKLCRAGRIPVHRVPTAKLTMLVRSEKHQGVAAVSGMRSYNTVEELREALHTAQSPPIFLIPASIEDPRNLGSIIRSCAAFGVMAILLEHKHTAPLNAAVAKAAAGMIERILIVRPRSLEGLLQELKTGGFGVIGADAESTTEPHNVNFTGPIVIILGGESRGIPPYLRKICTGHVRIPTMANAPSLNVAVAGGILLYESARQRRTMVSSQQ